ncbi:peptidase family T4 protein [Akanthomyces lecanii RCEF 1005]|uniref:Peptidase family T4 protein n=1 Tax=Akanthomyces lecanii RCEF 1005 TaxID=1081108 RepID=A0A162IHA6_CORDF|nr:peptidase family T4 protein [Akanthomyces lecanii RCEF 1005]
MILELIPEIKLGKWQRTGPKNGITDVKGVLVHTESIHDKKRGVNTGVTTILPRKDWMEKACYAGIFRYNGSGELTGSHWLDDTGLLSSPIVLTNSFAVGACHTGIYQYGAQHYRDKNGNVSWFLMPVVGETYDGILNDLSQFVVTPEHVVRGIEKASPDPVPEGNTGGGTAMTCHGFKAGTGTSSRLVPGLSEDGTTTEYTVAALVQANYGGLFSLTIAGAPVGRIFWEEKEREEPMKKARDEYEKAKSAKDGSIIVVIATDAPLIAVQLQRLARRATRGISRVGGYGNTTSGDVFIAFSTGTVAPGLFSTDEIRSDTAEILHHKAVDERKMDGLLEGAAEATEEAILNALCMAETMTGFRDRTVEAMPLDKVKNIVQKHIDLEKELTSNKQ